jgi:phosphonate transport system ATP-binding protein
MGVHLAAVGHRYGDGRVALEGITLQIAAGERVALIGPSGAGKSTLLSILGASLQPSAGVVELLGATPWLVPARGLKKLRARIGMVHQSPPLPPRQRVVTAVLAGRLGRWSLLKALVSLIYPVDPPGAERELARLEVADKLYARCDRLSGGQLQRVALARVLYQAPELLLADEPVSALDPALSELSLRVLCADAEARGATLIASLHAVNLALRHFPRVVGVRAGRIAFDLPAGAVTPALLHALYAGESPPAPLPAPKPAAVFLRC